jgi:hypothetical protein
MTTDGTRQAAAALCGALVLAVLGFAVGGDVGEVLRAAGLLGVVVALVVLAVFLLRRARP